MVKFIQETCTFELFFENLYNCVIIITIQFQNPSITPKNFLFHHLHEISQLYPQTQAPIDLLCQNNLESRANLASLLSACLSEDFTQCQWEHEPFPARREWSSRDFSRLRISRGSFLSCSCFLTLNLELKRASLQISDSNNSLCAALSYSMLCPITFSCFGLLKLLALTPQSNESVGLGLCSSCLHCGLWAGDLAGLSLHLSPYLRDCCPVLPENHCFIYVIQCSRCFSREC